MEHIEQPGEDALEYLEVPFVVADEDIYDGDGFLDFPERRGFEIFSSYPRLLDYDLLWEKGKDWTRQEAQHMLSFLQSWAFHGLIVEFFRICDIEVNKEDFVVHEENCSKIVTSRSLAALLRLWEMKGSDTSPEKGDSCYTKAHKYLQAVSFVVADFASEGFHENVPQFFETKLPGCDDLSLADVILLSIQLLGEALTRAAGLFSPIQDDAEIFPYWGSRHFLKKLLVRAGWCRSEIDDFTDQNMSLACLYYLSLVNRNILGNNHDQCNSLRCVLEDLNEETYETQHENACQGCRSVVFERRWSRRISQIVRQDATPLVTVLPSNSVADTQYKKRLQIQLSMAQQPQGSPKRLESRLWQKFDKSVVFKVPKSYNDLQHEKTVRYVCISHVWADGLGNVKRNALPMCQLLRVQALVNRLYPENDGPVPFWIDTVCVPRRYPERSLAIAAMRNIYSQAHKVLVLDGAMLRGKENPKATEMFMRIRASTWSRRLWTFHEAALAQRLYYQFPSSALASIEIWNRYQLNRRELDNQRRLDNEDWRLDKVWDASFWYSWSSEASRDAEKARRRQRIDALDPLFEAGIAFLHELENFIIEAPKEDYRRLAAMTLPLRWRWTSRLTDEPICLAGIFQRDAKELVHLTSVQKMRKLIGGLETVPTDLIFVNRPRLQQQGSRWIPATFLGGGSNATVAAGRRCIPATPSPRGLHVNLTGVTIPPQDKFAVHMVDLQEYIFIKLEDVLYEVSSVPQSQTLLTFNDYCNSRLAIILQEPLCASDYVTGALVTIQRSEPDGILCRHEHLVWVSTGEEAELLRSDEDTAITEAEYTGIPQAWCVG